MLFKTHVAFGFFLFLVLFTSIQDSYVNSILAFFVGIMAGSILVDIDSKKSTVGNYFLLRPFQFFIKHRGIVHSFAFGIFVSICFSVIGVLTGWAFFNDIAIGFFIGFVGHLFLDCVTKQRIMPFWPLFKTKFGLGIVRTGGIIETVIFVLLLLFNIGFAGYLMWFS